EGGGRDGLDRGELWEPRRELLYGCLDQRGRLAFAGVAVLRIAEQGEGFDRVPGRQRELSKRAERVGVHRRAAQRREGAGRSHGVSTSELGEPEADACPGVLWRAREHLGRDILRALFSTQREIDPC